MSDSRGYDSISPQGFPEHNDIVELSILMILYLSLAGPIFECGEFGKFEDCRTGPSEHSERKSPDTATRTKSGDPDSFGPDY